MRSRLRSSSSGLKPGSCRAIRPATRCWWTTSSSSWLSRADSPPRRRTWLAALASLPIAGCGRIAHAHNRSDSSLLVAAAGTISLVERTQPGAWASWQLALRFLLPDRLMPRQILVTSALPYANGPIHIGHLVEYIQTDIWVRFQKLAGHRCIYLCADDTHGTAIMISAKKAGVSEEQFIAKMNDEHQRDFAGFQIQFDNYGSTNSPENRALCGQFWTSLRVAGLIAEKDVSQLYDPVAGTFLADRFVKGTCPKCKSPNQYGDSCEKCQSTYTPADLIDPVSTLSGAKPELRSAKHLFVELEKLHGFLNDWTQSGKHLQDEVANYLKGHFLGDALRDWDISRPAPYFGFEIPDSPDNYWYVWFDAPIGYIASTWQWCKRTGGKLDDWWKSPATEIHHFIGKDITYFHTLFWPGMLKVAGFTLPTKVHIHGFLTVGGEKMSKTKSAC